MRLEPMSQPELRKTIEDLEIFKEIFCNGPWVRSERMFWCSDITTFDEGILYVVWYAPAPEARAKWHLKGGAPYYTSAFAVFDSFGIFLGEGTPTGASDFAGIQCAVAQEAARLQAIITAEGGPVELVRKRAQPENLVQAFSLPAPLPAKSKLADPSLN